MPNPFGLDEDERFQQALAAGRISPIVEKQYPGRDWGDLSPEEQASIYKSFSGMRAAGENLQFQGARMQRDAGKTVGPSNIYVNNPWDSLVGGAMSGYGAGLQGRANKDEAAGRMTAADLKARQDALDAEQRRKDEEERRKFLQSIVAGGAFR